MRYLNRIIFINSANVKYAEVAIDGNVHFIGTQGVGKSTSLRAILFFYNADKLKLGIEKGKKTFDEYYFPFGNSYVIYEVVRETGTYCIMAFKSQGRACFRFINSEYQQEHYIDSDGKAMAWDGIREVLGKKVGYTRKIDRYEEYRDILYGNNLGLDKEFRKYAIIESRQYQNLPRTIQNVFLNSKLDAEFIKQTIIMSLNEEDVKIDLDKYALHLKDFDTQLADINKWTEANKSGEIPVRKMAETIARGHAAIISLNKEKKETAVQLFHARGIAVDEQPKIEKKRDQQDKQRQTLQQKADELKDKFKAKREDIQKQINILDNDLKKIKVRAEYYESIDIASIIQRVDKKDRVEEERDRLRTERELLNTRFTEINGRYKALIQQQQNELARFESTNLVRKNKLREEFLQFKDDTTEEYKLAFAEIRTQHQEALEVARNTITQKKDNIHDLKLKKQKIQLQRYFEQEIELVKGEIATLQQKLKNGEIEIADSKKQSETMQKQWELDAEKSTGIFDRKIEKLHDDSKQFTAAIESIAAKLEKNKDSLYGWLSTNVQGWENNIGKIIDEETVLFQPDLSPSYTEGANDSVYGLKINLEDIGKKVKTVADYELERGEWLQKAEANRANIAKLIEERDDESNKLRSRYQGKIKELNNSRRQMEYELQRHKGQLQTNEVKYADLVRKAGEEKEQLLAQVAEEMITAADELAREEKELEQVRSSMEKQLENKEREQNRKIRAEDTRIKELVTEATEELKTRKQETADRIADIKQQQTQNLEKEGADVVRMADIDRELGSLQRELDYINANRDRVAEYNKDKRELLDNVDSFKTDKRLKETQLENEQEKYNLQKQKLQREIDLLATEINELTGRLNIMTDGLATFDSFKQTDHYKQIAEFEGLLPDRVENNAGLKSLIEALNGKIYTIIERYNDLYSAIRKFNGNFSEQNVFHFKTNLQEPKDFIEFAEMLSEFLEENKIVQYEKRVNERFATLIRQIGKETNELTSKGGEIQKVITHINRDFEERNFAGVIKSIKLQLSESKNNVVALLQAIRQFNDGSGLSLGVVDLFSSGDNEAQNKKAITLLKDFAKEIGSRKEKEIGLADSFELQFRIVENDNDSGWVEKLANVGSEGTDILVKAMVNIMLLNVFKDSASKRFKDFRMHCMMDEIGKLHPNNVKGILKFANDRNILLINSSPTSFNATDYRYTYLLSKDSKHVTTIKKLIKKGSEALATA
ncbi:ATP-binding protein [Flavipsychrobacter stenotrophus]|uniref:ATP-binding protein n=1 Tax=Flavipsychrobacter stenotrophus TaxID=2077091 RepID=A0A2S7SQK7_9BACT|nr:ATP-binding protein [Flavipsychrobacter stenotrophus]PQJ08907.1 ATP-binding protein [Flavipsychrobacter stenotrophus]